MELGSTDDPLISGQTTNHHCDQSSMKTVYLDLKPWLGHHVLFWVNGECLAATDARIIGLGLYRPGIIVSVDSSRFQVSIKLQDSETAVPVNLSERDPLPKVIDDAIPHTSQLNEYAFDISPHHLFPTGELGYVIASLLIRDLAMPRGS